MDDRAIAELRDLNAQDADLAERAKRLHTLAGEVAAIRSHAEAIEAFFADCDTAKQRLQTALEEAAAALEARRLELEDARAVLERSRDDVERKIARKTLVRATDHVEAGEARVARSVAELGRLEDEAAALPEELARLRARAGAVAESLAGLPSPDGDAAGLVEWTSRARASLFVGASQIDAQRERLIREANELATMLLGEATYGSTPSQALGRVEAALR